jgi:[protein-PII] uridylyltransferase
VNAGLRERGGGEGGETTLAFQLRAGLAREREERIRAFTAGGPVGRLLRGLSQVTDQYVLQAATHTGVVQFAAIAAVGGYGRAELFPQSDVDLLVVLAEPPDEAREERISALVQMLWDMGLAVGHAVRTVAECSQEAQADATVMTSLLEARRVCGPPATYATFWRELHAVLEPRAFLRAKLLEQQQRHTRFQDTPFALEPNCKESPGGLRDLQVLLWVARAGSLGASWAELARNGLMTPAEAAELLRAERLLKLIRARLHILAGRREDRIVFDLQHALAGAFGIAAGGARRASEVLMQRYYRAAKTVTQLNSLVLPAIEQRLLQGEGDAPRPIDDSFCVRAELLDLVEDDLFQRRPSEMLRAFLVWETHHALKGMSPRLLRALWNSRERMDSAFRSDPANRAVFLAILQQPRGVLHTLRLMNQWSVLGGYLPAFQRIVGQMQHDLFHAYTVDQHILMVVRNLRRFHASDFAHEYPMCSQLIADLDRSWLLTLAALFHDIAKGRGGDHSELGEVIARRFCRTHGLPREDTDLVAFLVRQHLTMSQVAQKQDLADPAVIERFARLVGEDRRLVALYLLTVADIRGTSPKVWNAWKARLLEDLFHRTRRLLLGQPGGQPIGADTELEHRKRESLRILRLYGVSESGHEPLWRELDVVYFLRHTAADIAWHARCLLVHVHADKPIVRTRLAPAGEGIEVLLYTKDHKDLFVRVCAYFDSRQVSVLDARVHTTRHGYALDTFLVSDHGRSGDYKPVLESVERELTEWMSRGGELPPAARGRLSRHSRHFPVAPEVHLQPDDTGRQYLLSVVATDRVGLLYSIARVLARHDVNLLTARILTLGERAEDVFLIAGEALGREKEQLQLEGDLLEALSP